MGSEKLTRPEEISALSKYLKHIKTVQEEHTELGKDVLGVKKKEVVSLGDRIDELDLGTTEIRELQDSVYGLSVEGKVRELPEERGKLSIGNKVDELPDNFNRLETGEGVNELPDSVYGLSTESNDIYELPDSVYGIVGKEIKELPSEIVSNPEKKKAPSLSEVIDRIEGKQVNKLPDSLSRISEKQTPDLSKVVDRIEEKQIDELPDSLSRISEKQVNSLPDSIDKIEGKEIDSLPNDIEKISEKQVSSLSSDVDRLIDDIRRKSVELSEDDLYNYTLGLLTSEESSELEKKTASLMSTYLSNSREKLSDVEVSEYESKLVEYSKTQGKVIVSELDSLEDTISEVPGQQNESELYDSKSALSIPKYRLPDWSLGWDWSDVVGSVKNAISWGDKIDISSYLRWTVENTIGYIPAKGSTRQALIDETLALIVDGRRKLEVLAKANRDRLPGDKKLIGETVGTLLSGGLDDTVRTLAAEGKKQLGSLIGGTDISNDTPKNRPGDGGTTEFDRVSRRVDYNEKARDNYTDKLDFKSNYLGGQGLKTTLEELAEGKDPDSLSSVEDLMDVLNNSPYITTVGKFGTDKFRNNSYTLDGNGYWEIILEPYVGNLNGNFSYLPAFREMDTWNKYQHGVNTYHDKWIPFTGFDLQKARMISKTLGLYDGEIAYPVSSEFTNELRISIADDSYKSWRWYFQKCMDASVYSSEIHKKDYYTSNHSNITVIDKSTQLVAFYKNIAFRIRVFVLTPQFSTIRKFDLLCILREFTEEFSGEIDHGGAPDLALSFSIVGEIPPINRTVTKNSIDLSATIAYTKHGPLEESNGSEDPYYIKREEIISEGDSYYYTKTNSEEE